MNNIFALTAVAGVCIVGCTDTRPNRSELIRRETEAIRCYCRGSARDAEQALLKCESCAKECEKQGVPGILFDQVYFRTYGRLYLVSKHLGKDRAAEEYLLKVSDYSRKTGTVQRAKPVRPTELLALIEKEIDSGMKVAWKMEKITSAWNNASTNHHGLY